MFFEISSKFSNYFIVKVPMHKVNWAAKQNFEFISNYKILQTCFTKMNIERNIDVDRLISGRYMDNLEFMQWYKRFFEMSVTDIGSYDAFAQRSKGKGSCPNFSRSISTIVNFDVSFLLLKGGSSFGGGSGGASKKAVSKPLASAPKQSLSSAPKSSAGGHHTEGSIAQSSRHSAPHVNQENAAPNLSNKISSGQSSAKSSSSSSAPSCSSVPLAPSASSDSTVIVDVHKLEKEISSLRSVNSGLSQSIVDMRTEMDGLEKERDFYFDKLREIEVLLQDLEDNNKGNELTASIFKILYATIDGFEPVPLSTEAATAAEGEAAYAEEIGTN